MKQKGSSEVSKPAFFALIVAVVVIIAWFGWHTVAVNGADSGKAQVDAAEKKMAAEGIDIKTVPRWSDMWYKYHPEYKGPHPPVKMPDFGVGGSGAPVTGAPGTTTSTQ